MADQFALEFEDRNMPCDSGRRRWMTLTAAAAVSVAVTPLGRTATGKEADKKEDDVPAVEDLMREHGLLRRALLVYSAAATRLSASSADVPLQPLGHTASLFRSFGENYHERSLEERHVFPPLIEGGGRNAALAKTLVRQHERGRQITDYISAVARKGTLTHADSGAFAKALTLFVRMYAHHVAIEDTVVFPAWKKAISPAQYRESTEQFEELEHKMFGGDGFGDALKQIAAIEEAFGLADLAALTAPPPPPLA